MQSKTDGLQPRKGHRSQLLRVDLKQDWRDEITRFVKLSWMTVHLLSLRKRVCGVSAELMLL